MFQFFPFVHYFYGLLIPLFFSYHFSFRVLFVILSSMGTCHGNSLARPRFALSHFHTLCYSSRVFPLCLFPSLANDIHILNLAHVISLAFDHFASQLVSMGLFVQPRKCSTWVPFSSPLGFIPLPNFVALLWH